MANKTKIVLASMFFLIVVLLHLLGLLFNENLAFFTKPFITISLVIVYLISVKKANFWFGKQRALNVKKYFESQGIPAVKLKASSKGETSPVVPNDSEENRAKNRRIEITVN